MQRKKFITALGLGLAGVCAGGCLSSCSKSGGEPNPGGGNPSAPTGVNFTVDLANEIKNPGETVVKNGVIVVRLSGGSTIAAFSAVQVACTHQGTSINFDSAQGNFVCPNHGSKFSTTGNVLNGPAATNLKQFSMAITGSILTVNG